MSQATQIEITAKDMEDFTVMEDQFNRRLWAQLGADDRNYQLFEQNLGLRGRLVAAFYVIAADLERGRGPGKDPVKVIARMGRAFDTMLPSLKKTFTEAKVLAALPETAGDARMIAICRQVGATGLAGLCEKKLTA